MSGKRRIAGIQGPPGRATRRPAGIDHAEGTVRVSGRQMRQERRVPAHRIGVSRGRA